MIIEVFGGITPHALAHVSHLAKRARGKSARDSTRYGTSRTSARTFFVHHTQRMSLAANQYDAKAIRKSLCGRKQALIGRVASKAVVTETTVTLRYVTLRYVTVGPTPCYCPRLGKIEKRAQQP